MSYAMDKRRLCELIKTDKNKYLGDNFIRKMYLIITKQPVFCIYRQVIVARKYKYYSKNKRGINRLKFIYYARKNNVLGRKNSIELHGEFGENFKISHGGVVITKNAIIGNNVKLHGNNCIGLKNSDCDLAPIIGNNVDIGYGVTIIGNIKIGNNIIIGANSFVNKSFLEENIVIAGVPAKKIKNVDFKSKNDQ